MACPGFVPLEFIERPPEAMQARAAAFYDLMRRRRTVRDFSDRPVPAGVIDDCLRTAGTAPSGANQQPWHFVVVADPALRRALRAGAEREERLFYQERAPAEWLEALAPLGTDADKPFLEIAPVLIVVFGRATTPRPDGPPAKTYYMAESVGIATGLLIAALHHAGLATLTHTPSPLKFLNALLGRPAHERPYLILVAGYPAEGAEVPDVRRKGLDEIATFL